MKTALLILAGIFGVNWLMKQQQQNNNLVSSTNATPVGAGAATPASNSIPNQVNLSSGGIINKIFPLTPSPVDVSSSPANPAPGLFELGVMQGTSSLFTDGVTRTATAQVATTAPIRSDADTVAHLGPVSQATIGVSGEPMFVPILDNPTPPILFSQAPIAQLPIINNQPPVLQDTPATLVNPPEVRVVPNLRGRVISAMPSLVMAE